MNEETKKKPQPNPALLFQSDLDDEMRDWVEQILALRTVEGFIAAYHYNLLILQKKGLAYEETERVYEYFNRQRRYLDRETFFAVLSRWKSNNTKAVKSKT